MNLTKEQVVKLADELTEHLAAEISAAIDAGSERDAITEDLTDFMRHYVAAWANEPWSENEFIQKINKLITELQDTSDYVGEVDPA